MKITLKSLIVAAAFATGFAGTAEAVPINSHAIKYFDANGTLVGERYLLCSAQAGHGGNVGTAYFVEEMLPCPFVGEGDPGWIDTHWDVINYNLPAGLTLQSACSEADCGGHASPEVVRLDGLWSYTPGWQ